MRAVSLLLAALVGLAVVAAQRDPVCQTALVKDGDSVTIIAGRYNVQPGALEAQLEKCELTPDYKQGAFLQPNQRICLPGWVSGCLNVQNSDPTGEKACMYYKVQQGDSMATIGNVFGIPQLDIERVNPGVEPAALAVGSYVKLPPWDDSCPAPGDTTNCRVYVAESGDSLSIISTAFVVDLAELQALNNNTEAGTVLQPGQRVFLPPFNKDACGSGVEVTKPSTCRAYAVQAGDTLFQIAGDFQTTTDLLISVNPELAAGGPLAPGTQVKLPPVPPPSPPSPPSPPPSPKEDDKPAVKPVEAPAPAPRADEEAVDEALAPEFAEAPAMAPASAPTPAPAPSEVPVAPSGAEAPGARVLLALLALAGAAAVLA
ncbi:spore coat assembly domain [Chlorella sorokiniana]|uniref:Spore coat assembly domain n=1 Tax=Chlorella sorokiniana TaxID=3076 RepID=A0A2P6U401_CHLSO|nr:spore coat assembly domain [Chlorella sorokiniana]|eukprot:PRW61029.1 spore coat assembly domain [Chlorella sorokiniana]